MLSYQYTARNPANRRHVKADVQADSEKSAAKLIRKEGLVPLDIKQLTPEAAVSWRPLQAACHAKDKVLFSRQLSTLINAGLPLVQSLRNVNWPDHQQDAQGVIDQGHQRCRSRSRHCRPPWRKHPKVFNQVYISHDRRR